MYLYNVLVSMPITEEYKHQLRAAVPDGRVTFARYEDLDEAQLAAFDAVVGNPDAKTLAKMNNLKLLQLFSSGVAKDYIALGQDRPGLTLCSASGAYGQALSEHMAATLLMLMKRLHEYRDAMANAAWGSRGSVETPVGKTVLVVGAGSIGTAFGGLMQKLGSKTIGLRRQKDGNIEGFDEVHTIDQLDHLLPQADVVALSLPETPQTIGIMSAARFSLMKPGSYFLNVGRGSAVDQDALLEALASGRLAGAAIDVTVPEPLPRDHPLWRQQNLLLTPHISGYYHLKATHDAVVGIAAHNLAAWPNGPFISRVDYQTGYRQKETGR